MRVGNADLIYKLEIGYRSYSIGKGYENRESKQVSHYHIWKSFWENNLA